MNPVVKKVSLACSRSCRSSQLRIWDPKLGGRALPTEDYKEQTGSKGYNDTQTGPLKEMLS